MPARPLPSRRRHGSGDDQPGDHGAKRIEAAENGDNDGGEARGRRDPGCSCFTVVMKLADAGGARQPSRQQEGDHTKPLQEDRRDRAALGARPEALIYLALHAVGKEEGERHRSGHGKGDDEMKGAAKVDEEQPPAKVTDLAIPGFADRATARSAAS